MTLNHVKFINVLKLFVGFVLMFIKNKELLSLFKHFHKLKIDLKKIHIFWKDAYLNEKNNIEKIKKTYVHNLNTNNKNDDEWDNLQSKPKEYV
jgi:hypothetical protein